MLQNLTSIIVALAVAAPASAPPPPTDANVQQPIAPSATPPTPTTAPAFGPDEVQLLNGGFVRGTITEVTPDRRVVIVPDGTTESRVIPWEEVAKVERGKHDPDARERMRVERFPQEPAPPLGPPPPEQPGPGRPRVHLELLANRPVSLFEVNSEIVASGYNASLYGIQYTAMCAAPCDRVIDGSRGQNFFLAPRRGGLLAASRQFSLDDRVGDVTLRVRPGNVGLRIAGLVLWSIGLAGIAAGAVFTALKSTRTTGIGLLAAGAPLFAAGLPMFIVGRTRYEFADR
ncbi:MAG TPA: hypothetical protein VFG69_15165 [Nannocystaceae bacterium]|nr:hypothetical protein [Nannocystaceae bacterium]